MKLRCVSVVVAMLFAVRAYAIPSRISSQILDLGVVHKIYMAPGLVSVMQLPAPITEVKVGDPSIVQLQISKNLPSELTLLLRKTSALTTNLIVRCGGRFFVFDLLRSSTVHQDLILVSASYGRAMSNREEVLIESSRNEKKSDIAESDLALMVSSK